MLEIAQMLSLYLWHSRFLRWLKACVMTAGFERVAHFLLLSPSNHTLTRGDTLNGEEITWFLHERCHNTHLNGDWCTSGPRRWSVLLPSLMVSPHVPLDVFLAGVLPHFFVSWMAPQVNWLDWQRINLISKQFLWTFGQVDMWNRSHKYCMWKVLFAVGKDAGKSAYLSSRGAFVAQHALTPLLLCNLLCWRGWGISAFSSFWCSFSQDAVLCCHSWVANPLQRAAHKMSASTAGCPLTRG